MMYTKKLYNDVIKQINLLHIVLNQVLNYKALKNLLKLKKGLSLKLFKINFCLFIKSFTIEISLPQIINTKKKKYIQQLLVYKGKSSTCF